jgi:hypothetical protein
LKSASAFKEILPRFPISKELLEIWTAAKIVESSFRDRYPADLEI